MITCVYGVPGSGKTYYAAYWIRKKVLQDDDVFLKLKDDVALITNIKLNLSDAAGYVYVENFEDFLKYCSVDFLQKVSKSDTKRKKIVYVIDEAQRLFAIAKKQDDLFFFFQYHRHYSVDVILITQTPSSLPKKIYELVEYLVEAVPKSVNIVSKVSFRYRVKHPLDRDVVLRRLHLKFDHVIFYLYSDMIYISEEDKPGNAFVRPLVFVFSIVIVFLFALHFFISSASSFMQSQKKQTNSIQKQNIQNDYIREYDQLINYDRNIVSGGSVGLGPRFPSQSR